MSKLPTPNIPAKILHEEIEASYNVQGNKTIKKNFSCIPAENLMEPNIIGSPLPLTDELVPPQKSFDSKSFLSFDTSMVLGGPNDVNISQCNQYDHVSSLGVKAKPQQKCKPKK